MPNVGTVVQVMSPIVDVRFSTDSLPAINNAMWGWSLKEYFLLDDHLGAPMPGVGIQERFDPNYDPAQMNVNTYWVTGLEPEYTTGKTMGVDWQGIHLYAPFGPYTNPPNAEPYYRHRPLLMAGTRDYYWYPPNGYVAGADGVPVGIYIIE